MKNKQQLNQLLTLPVTKAEFAQLFLDAVLSGSREQVSQFLDQYTASYYTLYQQPLVDMLLPRPYNKALMVAAAKNFLEVSEELCSRGAKLLEICPNGESVVEKAIIHDSVDVLKRLIYFEAEENRLRELADVARRNNAQLCLREIEKFEKILYTPAKISYIETIFPTQTREAQETFVWSLINGGYAECIKHLKNRGFDFSYNGPNSPYRESVSFIKSCLEQEDVRGVMTLVEGGINVNELDRNGETPLSIAILISKKETENSLENVRTMLNHPDVDVNMHDGDGYSMLELAGLDYPQAEVMRELIAKGANVNHIRTIGPNAADRSVLMTFLSELSSGNSISLQKALQVLLESGANMMMTDSNGRSAWSYLMKFISNEGHFDLWFDRLIEYGACIGISEAYHTIADEREITGEIRQVLRLIHLGMEEDKKEELYPDIWREATVNDMSSYDRAVSDTKETMLGAFLASPYMTYLNRQLSLPCCHEEKEKQLFKLLFLVADRLLYKPSRLQSLPPLMWLMICKLARRYSFSISGSSIQQYDAKHEESKIIMTVNPLISSLINFKYDIKKGWSVKTSAI